MFKTKLEGELKNHIKSIHEQITCKDCGITTTGQTQLLEHENTVHTKAEVEPTKKWVKPKKTFINRRVNKLQKEVTELKNNSNNLFNTLQGLPERPDLVKIKEHFTELKTEAESRAALDRLEVWVAKEKASKLQARIQEKKLLKAEKKRFKHNKENFEPVQKKP